MKAEAELEPFVRLIEALEPWLEELVLIGGWAHRLYRLAALLRLPLGANSAGLFSSQYCPANVCILITYYILISL